MAAPTPPPPGPISEGQVFANNTRPKKRQRPGLWIIAGVVSLLIALVIGFFSFGLTSFALPFVTTTQVEAGETIELEAGTSYVIEEPHFPAASELEITDEAGDRLEIREAPGPWSGPPPPSFTVGETGDLTFEQPVRFGQSSEFTVVLVLVVIFGWLATALFAIPGLALVLIGARKWSGSGRP